MKLHWVVLFCVACGGESGAKIPPVTSTSGTEPPPGEGVANPDAPPPSGTATGNAPPDTTPPDGPWPGSQLQTFAFPAQKNSPVSTCGASLVDITSHLHPTYGTQYDYPQDCIGWGQLNTLGVDDYLTVYWNPLPQPTHSAGFYLMKNKTAYLTEPPSTHLSDVAAYVPPTLRGPSYQTRLVDSVADFNSHPTYLFDELAIELNGAEVAMDIASRVTTPREVMVGPVETAFYALALGAAIETLDPAYAKSETQLRELLGYQIERAMTFAKNGANVPMYASTTESALLDAFKTGPAAKALRNYARRELGPSYCTKVLGIGGVLE